MKQSHAEIIAGYEREDPWGYKTSAADLERKKKIIDVCRMQLPPGKKFKRALDVACGEAWISADLPAEKIYGWELSPEATRRFPANVIPVTITPAGSSGHREHDLVVCTGALYGHYDWKELARVVCAFSSKVIVTCAIAEWECVPAIEYIKKHIGKKRELKSVEYFPYARPEASYTQVIRVFS